MEWDSKQSSLWQGEAFRSARTRGIGRVINFCLLDEHCSGDSCPRLLSKHPSSSSR